MYRFEDQPPVQEEAASALAGAGESLAVAESLTGGLVGALLTEVPGASDFFDRSLVTYTYEAKREELGVQQVVLGEIGAVNGIVAEQMARGVRNMAGTTWGLSTTGIAGPPDEEHDQPVGTVYVGVARGATDGYESTAVDVEQYRFGGGRSEIKEQAARQALEDLEEKAAAGPPEQPST